VNRVPPLANKDIAGWTGTVPLAVGITVV